MSRKSAMLEIYYELKMILTLLKSPLSDLCSIELFETGQGFQGKKINDINRNFIFELLDTRN